VHYRGNMAIRDPVKKTFMERQVLGMTMEKKSGTEGGLVKILAIFIFVFLGNAAAGTVIIQDGQVGTSNGTSPLRPIHIAATQDANLRLQDTSGSGPAAYIEFYNDTTRWGYVGLGGHDTQMTIGTTAYKNLSFYTNNASKMMITADGSVGIGTAAPQGKLSVLNSQVTNDLILKLEDTRTATSADFLTKQAFYDYNGEAAYVGARHNYYFSATPRALVFGVSGNEYMRISNAGKVGIGTTTPHGMLEVRSASNAEIVLNRQGVWGSVPLGLKFATDDAVTSNWTFGMLPDNTNNVYLKKNDETLMTFNYSSSNVGIGTATLASGMKLHVAGTGYFEDNVTVGTGTAASAIRIRDRGANWLSIESTGTNAYQMDMGGTSSPGTLKFNEFNVSVMGGNVGIGTTDPQGKLHVSGNNAVLRVGEYLSDNRDSIRLFANGTDSTIVSPNELFIVDNPIGYLALQPSGGNVGIGTNAPTAKLHVNSSSNDAARFTTSTSAAYIALAANNTINNAPRIGASGENMTFLTGGAERIRITDTGNVGIGNSTPMSKLQVGTYAASGNEYLQIDTENSIPASADCDSDAERGRMIVDGSNNRLYVCMGPSRGWDYLALTD